MKLSPKRKAVLADILNDYVRVCGQDPRRKQQVMLATILSKQFETECKREATRPKGQVSK